MCGLMKIGTVMVVDLDCKPSLLLVRKRSEG